MTGRPSVGDAIPDVGCDVALGPMKVFSVLMGDPNPIHYDPQFVRGLGLGDHPVNQGTITMGYVLNAVVAWAGGVERVLRFRCRFAGNVVEGDHVVVSGHVTGVQTDGDATTADLKLTLTRQTGEVAITGRATVRVE